MLQKKTPEGDKNRDEILKKVIENVEKIQAKEEQILKEFKRGGIESSGNKKQRVEQREFNTDALDRLKPPPRNGISSVFTGMENSVER